MRADKWVGSGRYANDPHAMVNALFETNEFVHMKHVEELIVERDAAAVPLGGGLGGGSGGGSGGGLGKTIMRAQPLSAASTKDRVSTVYNGYVRPLFAAVGGTVGMAFVLADMCIRVMDRSHKGAQERETFDEEAYLQHLLSNGAARRKILRALKRYEGAPISRFRFVNITAGVTQQAFNGLRFAMHGWAPGQGRLLRDLYAYLRQINDVWMPGAAECGGELAETVEDVEAAAAAAARRDVGVVEEEDVLLRDDETARDELESMVAAAQEGAAGAGSGAGTADAVTVDVDALRVTDSVRSMAIGLLAAEYPNESAHKHADMWAGDGKEEKDSIWEGAQLLHALARGEDGRLLGFGKALVVDKEKGEFELYLDELIVGPAAQGMRLAAHLMGTLMEAVPTATRVRLQYDTRKTKVVNGKVEDLGSKVYAPMGIATQWRVPRSGRFEDVGPSPACMRMVTGTRTQVLNKTHATRTSAPLADGISVSTHVGGYAEPVDPAAAAPAAAAAAAAAREEEEDEEAIAAEAAERAEANVPAAESYGIKSVLDGVVVLLIPLLFLARVVLPESPWSKFGLHLSCDAATLRNAPRKFKSVTTVMLRALCYGVVRAMPWGDTAVQYMAPGAMNPLRGLKLRTWMGKDNRLNVRRRMPHARAWHAAAAHRVSGWRAPTLQAA